MNRLLVLVTLVSGCITFDGVRGKHQACTRTSDCTAPGEVCLGSVCGSAGCVSNSDCGIGGVCSAAFQCTNPAQDGTTGGVTVTDFRIDAVTGDGSEIDANGNPVLLASLVVTGVGLDQAISATLFADVGSKEWSLVIADQSTTRLTVAVPAEIDSLLRAMGPVTTTLRLASNAAGSVAQAVEFHVGPAGLNGANGQPGANATAAAPITCNGVGMAMASNAGVLGLSCGSSDRMLTVRGTADGTVSGTVLADVSPAPASPPAYATVYTSSSNGRALVAENTSASESALHVVTDATGVRLQAAGSATALLAQPSSGTALKVAGNANLTGASLRLPIRVVWQSSGTAVAAQGCASNELAIGGSCVITDNTDSMTTGCYTSDAAGATCITAAGSPVAKGFRCAADSAPQATLDNYIWCLRVSP